MVKYKHQGTISSVVKLNSEWSVELETGHTASLGTSMDRLCTQLDRDDMTWLA